MRIRSALPTDAEAIAAVHVQAWRETYTGLLPETVIARNTPERRHALWREVLESGTRDLVVAHDGRDAVVGFASGGPMPPSVRGRAAIAGYDAYLDAIYLVRSAQGRGRGRALLAALVERLRARGLHALAFHVVATNDAVCFYEHLGAQFIHAEPLAEGLDEGEQLAYGWPALPDLVGLAR